MEMYTHKTGRNVFSKSWVQFSGWVPRLVMKPVNDINLIRNRVNLSSYTAGRINAG